VRITDCEQDGKLLMSEVIILRPYKQQDQVRASELRPVTPSEWDARQSNPRTTWADLLETQLSLVVKSFDLQ